MTSSTANPLLLSYFQRQQTPAGWFDLLSVMVDGMVRNVGEAESQPFLRQMGASLAERFPLPASQTIGELEANINALLAEFNWGYIDIDASEEGLSFRHQGLPVSRDENSQTRWCYAFCAILEGLYSRWLQGQGGQSHLAFSRERLYSVSDVVFRYANPQ